MHYLGMIMNKRWQILYKSEPNNKGTIASFLEEEAMAMESAGFLVGTQPDKNAQQILYRGCTIWKECDYPQHQNLIQGWKQYSHTLFLSLYYPFVESLTIPTFFSGKLDSSVINEIKSRGWEEAFIKNDVSALIDRGVIKSLWPNYTLSDIEEGFRRLPPTEKYAIRKRVNLTLYEEERYWILNHHAYHRTGIIPDIVKRAVELLKPIGSRYYVIDATPDVIVEINPGETSDRYIENSPELFASWFADSFIRP